MNILIVEDERPLAKVLRDLLEKEGYTVDVALDGAEGEEYALTGIYDGIVLDIMLPGKSGLEVLRAVRGQKLSTPVLLLTARSEVEDKISGLDSGADDYLTKPFSTGELLARVRAITRRKGEYAGELLSFADVTLDRNTYKLSNKDKSVTLGAKEFQILEMLLLNTAQVIPKERFIEKIWGFNSDAEYNTIEVYISFLRKKLAAIRSTTQIRAIRGVGYAMEENHD